MRIAWETSAWDDYCLWQTADRKVALRINRLIKEASRAPDSGIGKPEALRGDLSGLWSRRITDEHRLVYAWTPEAITIIACRYHYGD